MKIRYLEALPTFDHILFDNKFIMINLYYDMTIIKRWLFIFIKIESICIKKRTFGRFAAFDSLKSLLISWIVRVSVLGS